MFTSGEDEPYLELPGGEGGERAEGHLALVPQLHQHPVELHLFLHILDYQLQSIFTATLHYNRRFLLHPHLFLSTSAHLYFFFHLLVIDVLMFFLNFTILPLDHILGLVL